MLRMIFFATENNLSEIKLTEKIPFNIKDGYIKFTNYSEIVNWVQENIFSQIISNEIFPLFRNKDVIPKYSFVPGKTLSLKKTIENYSYLIVFKDFEEL